MKSPNLVCVVSFFEQAKKNGERQSETEFPSKQKWEVNAQTNQDKFSNCSEILKFKPSSDHYRNPYKRSLFNSAMSQRGEP